MNNDYDMEKASKLFGFARKENETDTELRKRLLDSQYNTPDSLEPLRKYIMNIPTVFRAYDENTDISMAKHVVIESKLPLSEDDFKRIKELSPVIYVLDIKNIYEGGEKTIVL